MPTPPLPARKRTPPPPQASQLPPSTPLPRSLPQEAEPVQALPEGKKLKIQVRHGYPINIPHLGRRIMPGETAEVDDHAWIRRQIELNTFVEV